MRAKTGTRIEEVARLCDLVGNSIRRQIPKAELDNILDNLGLPYSGLNLSYSNTGQVGSADADLLVSLKENHRPTAEYVHRLRKTLPREFPGTTFYFLPADIVTQILNFGLPSPIDIQIVGNDVNTSKEYADKILPQLKLIPGAVDLHVHQVFDQPKLHIEVDRTKAAESGFTQNDVSRSLLTTLSGSFQTQPTFWLNPRNGVSYSLATQTPQYRIQSLQDLQNIPISGAGQLAPEILNDVAGISRESEPAIFTHYNIRRTVDIYGSAQGRDLGGVGRDIQKVLDANKKSLARGTEVVVRGQVQTMRTSFEGLLAGLAGAIVLVYLLIVVNFQSWLDPFIIITALPAGAGRGS